jgi:hypothetical protein
VKRYNQQQKELLREQISTMNPYKFEHLVGQLLEAMGYEQVEVTKASGDKGVDVVGKVQVGITTITEVVQVKRMQNTITRPLSTSYVARCPTTKPFAARLSPREICGEMRRSGVVSRSRTDYVDRRRPPAGAVD